MWKTAPNKTPLNIVKTMLQQWVQAKRRGIVLCIDRIPVPNPQAPPQVILYINQLLAETLHEERVDVVQLAQELPSRQRGAVLIRKSEFRGLTGTLSREQVKQALNVVFRRIGNKETCNQGLADLFCLTSEHPEVDIKPYLQRTALQFQQFIEKGLQDMAIEALQLDADAPKTPAAKSAAIATTTPSTENVDPNNSARALATPSAKLRALKERLGMSPAPVTATATTLSVAATAPLVTTAALSALPRPTPTTFVTSAPAAGTSLDTLRARLATIKKNGNM